jgi:hypothetical protein
MCFGVGLNNFATGRIRMSELEKAVEPPLRAAGGALLTWYGHTGNLTVEGEDEAARLIAMALAAATDDRPWAVLHAVSVKDALHSLDRWPEPEAREGVRWTPGLAISVETRQGLVSPVDSPARARLCNLAPGIVGVYKEDLLDTRGYLDRDRRQGGWGAVSRDVARQLGGTWTARSARVLWGLNRRSGL